MSSLSGFEPGHDGYEALSARWKGEIMIDGIARAKKNLRTVLSLDVTVRSPEDRSHLT